MRMKFGLIGTITEDEITFDSGQRITGLGGVLYQAAVLCGLGEETSLYTNLGEDLADEVNRVVKDWPTLQKKGIRQVPGPGNQVHLHYPEKGERIEVLKSVVPHLRPEPVIEDLPELGMLILVVNSGFDIQLSDWRKIVRSASCPLWMDVHSLCLSRELNVPRKYHPANEWEKWAEGVSFLQANVKEAASMLGVPDQVPPEDSLLQFGESVFDLGVKAVYLTLGKDGVFVMKPGDFMKISAPQGGSVIDTTGCGDVFCGGAAVKLVSGKDPFDAARFGLELASRAVGVKGIAETFSLVEEYQISEKQP
jgi:hypothetical protein